MEICDRVDFGVSTGRTIVDFLATNPRSSAILTSAFLVLSPYYSDGTTYSVR